MKRKVFLGTSIVMLVFAVSFVVYALNNPQASFPWGNQTTIMIYVVYLVIMVGCFSISRVLRKQ